MASFSENEVSKYQNFKGLAKELNIVDTFFIFGKEYVKVIKSELIMEEFYDFVKQHENDIEYSTDVIGFTVVIYSEDREAGFKIIQQLINCIKDKYDRMIFSERLIYKKILYIKSEIDDYICINFKTRKLLESNKSFEELNNKVVEKVDLYQLQSLLILLSKYYHYRDKISFHDRIMALADNVKLHHLQKNDLSFIDELTTSKKFVYKRIFLVLLEELITRGFYIFNLQIGNFIEFDMRKFRDNLTTKLVLDFYSLMLKEDLN